MPDRMRWVERDFMRERDELGSLTKRGSDSVTIKRPCTPHVTEARHTSALGQSARDQELPRLTHPVP